MTKYKHPDPYRFLDQPHERHGEGRPNDDVPGMGNGVDWNEFHSPTRYPNGTD
ncbi:hypothetical protein [Bifidobacterium pseudolongum]|uniref:hypothetical protein n=1 Tax=Bifidobacterium pseudolongum TaxID=1694 RepID=UPI0013EAD804|nr:hypothetical protein [Bifidobacterium pseudolongum]